MTARLGQLFLGLALMVALPGCGLRATAQATHGVAPPGGLRFADASREAGIRFQHQHGGTSPFTILETAGSGCAFLDYEGDGRLDLLLLSSRPAPAGGQSTVVLYRNRGDGTFADVTAEAGLQSGQNAMGCATGDFDGDGRLDLYVTGYGQNALYRNRGNGTFEDVTKTAGVAAGGWSTSAAFSDYDGDGDLDLYVARYVVFDERSRQLCSVRGVMMACAPITYPAQSGILYRNNGNGTFTDSTQEAGLHDPEGRGFGVVWSDYDADRDPDLFVANDAGANNLFRNDGNGRFRDVALLQGVAYGHKGDAEGSMGVDAADYDGDGRLDFFVTNFQDESNALYRNRGEVGFTYESFPAGLGAPSVPMLGFGTGFFDPDNDGDLDLFVANGHVQDTISRLDSASSFEQAHQLYENLGDGVFRDFAAAFKAPFTRRAVGRGAAFGDYDNDGDLDILVNNNGGSPMLLRNEGRGDRHWLRVRLIGVPPNTAAVGARVTLSAGGKPQVREVRSGFGYASASDFRLHFGLGRAAVVPELRVRWPDGGSSVLRDVPAGQELAIYQEKPER